MNFDNLIITNNSQETRQLGIEFTDFILKIKKDIPKAILLCLYGDLGSGKTTLVQGIAEKLGLKGRIISPTFIILKRYNISLSELFLYHLDLYRLNNLAEIEILGLNEILDDKDSIMIVEWAEKMSQILPKQRIDIKFNIITENRRSISIKSSYPI
jgi:tRNA threonylcarbamoyladenosine biosynthesis protein TsaE